MAFNPERGHRLRAAIAPLAVTAIVAPFGLAGFQAAGLSSNSAPSEVGRVVHEQATPEQLANASAQTIDVSGEAGGAHVSHDEYTTGPPPVSSSVAGFGVVSIPADPKLAWPVIEPKASSGFGERAAPCAGCSSFHDGVDYTPGAGTPVMAIASGAVSLVAAHDEGLGTHIEIQHNIDGRVFTSTYAHLEAGSPQVSLGDPVVAGQVIGRVGSTGQSTGPHLHLELYGADGVRIDGDAWLRSRMLR